ncbi:CAP domain-containing protein [Sunxiuqinia sp. A32]|uniref:CAP domain-containing protein n=1 Tax=Sunxiuqinia sp. A32 TaxID=3461496 RepID=UPI004045938F
MNAILNILTLACFLNFIPTNTSLLAETSSGQAWSTSLNTAEKAVYLKQYEKDIILEINKVRSDPARYATEYLEPLRSTFDGLKFTYPGEIPLKTREGVVALNECIQALKTAESAPALLPSKGLSQGAKLLVNDQKTYGGSGHITKSGWTTDVRLRRFGEWQSRLAENIVYGHQDARHAVISMLIDDGVSNRGHRNNILDPEFQKIGVAADTHPTYRYFCTIEFTDDFIEK